MARSPGVYGVKETLDELQKLDKQLKFRAIQKMKSAGQPMANAMAAQFPEKAPVSGMEYGKFKWNGRPKIAQRYRARRNQWYSGSFENVWNLMQFVTPRGDISSVVYDTARNGKLGAQLTKRYGEPSRAMWRVDQQLKDDTQKAIIAALRDYTKYVNEKFRTNINEIRTY